MNKEFEFTEQERELTLMIRRYKKSKHNPSLTLKKWIYELFSNLLNDD